MKTIRFFLLLLIAAVVSGCADKKATEEKARQDADAKARAEAARKEMETLPKVFQSRYNKRLEPQPKQETAAPAPQPAQKP